MSEFRHLGRASNEPVEKVDLIPWKGGPIVVHLDCEEFTSICPVTNQPDFATLEIEYVPDQYIVETKSLKLYLWNYRQQPIFNEHAVDTIAADLHGQLAPRWIRVSGQFNARGGIRVTATAEKGKKPEQRS